MIRVGEYDYWPGEIVDDLDGRGEYEMAQWAEGRLEDPDFRDRLVAAAEAELEVNGDPDAGYDESSAIVSALRDLYRAELESPGGEDPSEPLDRGPRSRLSDLAERTSR